MKLGETTTVGTNNVSNKVTESEKLNTISQMGATGTTLLQKRSCRLMSAQIKKKQASIGGGTQLSNKTSLNIKSELNKGPEKQLPRKYNKTSQKLRSRILSGSGMSERNACLEASERSLQEDSYSVNAPTDLKSTKSTKKGYIREIKESLPARTIDAEQEEEIIRLLEKQQRQRLEEDPMKELNEALMDRTTASQNRKQRVTHIQTSTIQMHDIQPSNNRRKYQDPSDVHEQEKGHKLASCQDSIAGDFIEPAPILDSGRRHAMFAQTQKRQGRDFKAHKIENTRQSDSESMMDEAEHMLQQHGLIPRSVRSPETQNMNKRNNKLYQKNKKFQKGASKGISQEDISHMEATHPPNCRRGLRVPGSQISNGEYMSAQKSVMQNNDHTIKQPLEEEKIISSQDLNLSENQLEKIEDTPQSNDLHKTSDQNKQKDYEDLRCSKSEWIQQKSRHAMAQMNQFIKPLPTFGQLPVPAWIKTSFSQNLVKSNQRALKGKANRIGEKEQDFRSLTLKMMGLTNMISMMQVTQMSNMPNYTTMSQRMNQSILSLGSNSSMQLQHSMMMQGTPGLQYHVSQGTAGIHPYDLKSMVANTPPSVHSERKPR